MGGGKTPYTVPDWRTYTVGEHTPLLQKTQRMLAAKGLKDPWLRNEAWRYDTRVWGRSPVQSSFRYIIFRGFVPGLILALISTAYTKYSESKGHHGNHH